jgi:hypothetical protein
VLNNEGFDLLEIAHLNYPCQDRALGNKKPAEAGLLKVSP